MSLRLTFNLVLVLATLGGIVGPALVYTAGCFMTGTHDDFGNGWAVPCATDIAFSYLVARMIFGMGHPAIAFLLLLAIADDAAGLLILAVFYPSAPVVPIWLLLTAAAMALAVAIRQRRIHTHWAYLVGPGLISWYSFYQANIHPALGLVPIIPLMPHAHTDLGLYAPGEAVHIDLKRTGEIYEAIKKYGVCIAQHGITGTPLDLVGQFADYGIRKGNVGTEWQNIVHRHLPKALSEEIKRWTEENKQEIKKATKPFKEKIDNIPDKNKKDIEEESYIRAKEYIKAFRAEGTASTVLKALS